jgi:2-succinyl-5-enolpyruvyl-6-hydroxy-3-cyclohexene-1-carboxylate synthase
MTDAVALRLIADELHRAGVTDVVICPGSRSTPLVLATRMHPALRVRALLDERSAGFFALGLARASRRPVAVIVTSGTAVANLLPAVIEASLARVPLLLLTADRPPELHGRGAPQTIEQAGIFGGFVRWFAELPLLDGAPETRCHVQSVIGRAVAMTRGRPAGPVHLNFPFREPLVPTDALGPLEQTGASADAQADGSAEAPADGGASRPFTDVVTGRARLASADLDDLAERIAAVPRGLIVAGPADDPELPAAIASLAAATGYPIAADPLSGVRCGPHDRSHVLSHADHLVRPGPWRDAHLPGLVIRFGATPTSKPLLTLLTEASPVQIVVDGDAGWIEPAIIPTTFVHADATSTACELADRVAARRMTAGDGAEAHTAARWAGDWCEADRKADRALLEWLAALESRGEPFEGLPFVVLSRTLPDGAMLWAGNSMPVRDLDDWFTGSSRSIRLLSNRGANGIDGVVSTALGAAAAGAGPVTLVVGDVSFLHDLNALVASHLHGLSATIVLVDNDGCGIFSFLPQARTDAAAIGLPAHYEELFGTPHGIDVGPIVTALGGECRVVDGAGLRAALADPVAPAGVRVLHFRTGRARNVEHHRQAAEAVVAALARA